MNPSWTVEHECADNPDNEHHDSDDDADVHSLTVFVVDLRLPAARYLGTETIVFEPTSPSSGFDNLY
jgi:hypothetical protein